VTTIEAIDQWAEKEINRQNSFLERLCSDPHHSHLDRGRVYGVIDGIQRMRDEAIRLIRAAELEHKFTVEEVKQILVNLGHKEWSFR
jgi:hypothetical protein